MNQFKLIFFNAQSGAPSARLEHEDGSCIHLHSIVKPENEHSFFGDIQIWSDRIIILGCGLGYHLSGLINKIPDFAQVLIIDYYEELTLICKDMFKLHSTLTISNSTGNPSVVINQFLLDGKNIQVIKHPPSYLVHRKFYDSLLNSAYRSEEKKSTGKPLLLYGKFFLQQEIKNAVISSGVQPVLFDYTCKDSIQSYYSELQRIIEVEKPEFILSVNMLGIDGNGILSDLTFQKGIPVVVWFVDDPRPILLHQKQFVKSNMMAFCWEKSYIPLLKTVGFSLVEYLPLATDTSIFNCEQVKKGSVSVGFVGSSMGLNFLQGIREKFLWHDKLRTIVNLCADKLLQNSDDRIENILDEVCNSNGCSRPFSDERNLTWFYSYIIHTASMFKRQSIVCGLLEQQIETFGDPEGWKVLCGPALKTHPDIDYRRELAAIYRSIDININITSCQMPKAVNQRVFDIPACGGFVISDLQDDLKLLFDSEEIVTYESISELNEKIRYYKNHENQRFIISENARKRILREHTYANRYAKICEAIRK